MTIGSRLGIAFSLVLLIATTVAYVSQDQVSRLSLATRDVVARQSARAEMAQAMDIHGQRAASLLLLLLQTPARDRRVPLYGAMDAEVAALDDAMHRLIATSADDGATGLISSVADLRHRYGRDFHQTVETIEISGNDAARKHFNSHTQASLEALLKSTQALATQQRAMVNATLSDLEESERASQRLIIGLSVVTVLAGSALAWRITRSIVGPVAQALAAADAVAAGRLNEPVPAGGKDEVGKLLQALRVMRDSIADREERLLRVAFEDRLTGLANRNRLLQALTQALREPSCGLIVLDVDRFGLINQAIGFDFADSLLQHLGSALQQSLLDLNDSGGVLARIWGNQFAIVLPGVDAAGALARAQRIQSFFVEPLSVQGNAIDVEVTLGVALFPQHGSSGEDLLRSAEGAMRSAKGRRERLGLASGPPAPGDPARLRLIGDMRAALDRGEFVLHYQPKLALADDSVHTVEALLRWNRPGFGMVAPGSFIPFAEQTGFIRELTPRVLDLAMRDACHWRALGLAIVPAVNLSAHDLLNPAFFELVAGLLQRHGCAPQDISMEVTESALMQEPERAIHNLQQLQSLGIRLSIDDYGSGQASLAYLKDLPVHELKIDRVFVTDVPATPRNGAIVRSTILLCHSLGLTVVAEGAETAAEMQWLRDAGCDYIQGYAVARPMPAAALLEWLNAQAARAPAPSE